MSTPTAFHLAITLTGGLVGAAGYFLLEADPPLFHLPLILAAAFGVVVSAYLFRRRRQEPR